MKLTPHLLSLAAVLLAAALAVTSWLSGRRSSAQLAAALASQNAVLARSSAQQHQRDAQLAVELEQIAAGKRRVQTPQQAAAALASVLPPLPLPLSHVPPQLSPVPALTPAPAPDSLIVPPADLKPLYDVLADCRACALERDALKSDLADEQAKTAALTRQRDAAMAAARGGAFWPRLRRAAKWFAIGAAVGALAASSTHR